MSADGGEGEIGYRRPPVASRFPKGTSGNPRGRPRGSKNRTGIPYDEVLGQMVTIREDGAERQVTAAEAILLQMTKEGLEGNGAAGRQVLRLIDRARALGTPATLHSIDAIEIIPMSFNVNASLRSLRMGRILDRFRDSARVVLEPWIVEAALARFGARRLSKKEQRTVLAVTRTPHKVSWPEWWTERPLERKD